MTPSSNHSLINGAAIGLAATTASVALWLIGMRSDVFQGFAPGAGFAALATYLLMLMLYQAQPSQRQMGAILGVALLAGVGGMLLLTTHLVLAFELIWAVLAVGGSLGSLCWLNRAALGAYMRMARE